MKIAILGCGTIGSGVYELLKDRSDISVKRILDIRKWMDIMTTDIADIVNDAEIETVVETMGGLHPAREFAIQCLTAGKNYITANKFLVSEFGEELEGIAREKGVSFLFGAACGGGIPFLTNLSMLREIDKIVEVGGILNGTTNFILDKIFTDNQDYDSALKEAQALGYAERDPSADVDGLDTQRKLMLACAVAFGKLVKPADIPTFGIRNVSAIDVEWARKHDSVIRLVAKAVLTDDGIAASVQPKICALGSTEAGIRKNINYTYYNCANAGLFTFTGQGAGKLPTASNIIRDAVDAGNGKKSMLPEAYENTDKLAGTVNRYYLRVEEAKAADVFESSEKADGYVYGITKPVALKDIISDACFVALMD